MYNKFFTGANPNFSDPRVLQIAKLRQDALKCKKKTNELTSQLWDLDCQLSDDSLTIAKINCLQKEKDAAEFQQIGSEAQYNHLLKIIHDLELEVYGKSDVRVGGFEPFKLR